MCTMHDNCLPNAFEGNHWVQPLIDGVNITALQDSSEVDYWRQVGGGLKMHDDLVVYDRCGGLFMHLCTEGPMGTCPQMGRKDGLPSNLLNGDGYATLRDGVLAAAKSSANGCRCTGRQPDSPALISSGYIRTIPYFTIALLSIAHWW